eukprot:353426-Chlamydomonas_euryale.AAC.11
MPTRKGYQRLSRHRTPLAPIPGSPHLERSQPDSRHSRRSNGPSAEAAAAADTPPCAPADKPTTRSAHSSRHNALEWGFDAICTARVRAYSEGRLGWGAGQGRAGKLWALDRSRLGACKCQQDLGVRTALTPRRCSGVEAANAKRHARLLLCALWQRRLPNVDPTIAGTHSSGLVLSAGMDEHPEP